MTLDFKGFFLNKNYRQREINDLDSLVSRRWVRIAATLARSGLVLWHTDEFHVAKLLAVKRTVATVS
jgi:hypothetical protein